MNEETLILTCPRCGTKNRVPRSRLYDRPVCGRCHAPLPVESAQSPRDIRDEDFSREVLSSPVPVLVEFMSPHCPYCRMLAPVIDQLAARFGGRIKIVRLNIDVNSRMASLFGIQGTPTLLLFKNGKAIDRMVGILSLDEIERRLLPLIEKS